MDTLTDFLLTELRKVHARTYYRTAPTGAAMPYAVFTVGGTQDEHREDFSLDINIWSTRQAGRENDVDTLSHSFKCSLNRLQTNAASFTTRLRYLSSSPVPDPDTNIMRREVRFICQTYWK